MTKLQHVLRGLCLALALSVSLFAMGQNSPAPIWVAHGWVGDSTPFHNQPRYSSDGTRILMCKAGVGFSIYNPNNFQVVRHEEFAHFTDACFSKDGKYLYYSADAGSGYGIYRYQIYSRQRLALGGLNESGPIRHLVISKDGQKLAYSSALTSTTDRIGVYNLMSGQVMCSVDHPRQSRVDFINGDTQIVANGPTIYDLSGALVRSNPSPKAGEFSVSPDGTKIVCFDQAFFTYSIPDLALLWTRGWHTNSVEFHVNRDGSAVYVSSAATTGITWGNLVSLSMADGSYLNQTQATDVGSLCIFAVSPTADRLMAIDDGGSKAVMRAFTSVSGRPGHYLGDLFSGQSLEVNYQTNFTSFKLPMLRAVKVDSGGTPVSAYLSFGKATGAAKSSAIINSAQDGSVLASNDQFLLSPDCKYYVVLDSASGAHFYKASDHGASNQVALVYIDPVNLGGQLEIYWITPNLLWAKRRDNLGIVLISFTGTKAEKTAEFSGTIDLVAMSSDGKQVAMRDGAGSVKVCNAKTKAALGTIAPLPLSPIDDIRFVASHQLVIHEFNALTSENTLRVYLVGATPKLLHTFTAPAPSAACEGIVSALGNYYAFSKTTVSGADQYILSEINVLRTDGTPLWYYSKDITGFEFSADEYSIAWTTTSGTLVSQVLPPVITKLEFSPATVTGSGPVTGTITLNHVVNNDTTIDLGASTKVLTVPSSVTVPAGSSLVSFPISTSEVLQETNAIVRGFLQGAYADGTVQIHPATVVTSLTSNRTDFTGTGSIDLTIGLSAPAPSGFSVVGSSNAPAIVIPPSISIPAGQTSYVLTVRVKKVAADRTATITIGGKTVNLTLHKP